MLFFQVCFTLMLKTCVGLLCSTEKAASLSCQVIPPRVNGPIVQLASIDSIESLCMCMVSSLLLTSSLSLFFGLTNKQNKHTMSRTQIFLHLLSIIKCSPFTKFVLCLGHPRSQTSGQSHCK